MKHYTVGILTDICFRRALVKFTKVSPRIYSGLIDTISLIVKYRGHC